MKDKLIIELEDWDHTCGDGCCYTWGVDIKVNGVKLKHNDDSIQSILQSVLEHLGYTVEINR